MPRIGTEPQRRQSLIDAAILTIGEQGSLDVSVREIANRAGMSPALAFHYFGGKDEIITETMRFLMRDFATEVRRRLVEARTRRERIEAVVRSCFAPSQFERTTMAAWLVFYLRAYSSPSAARLLHIYTRRLRSNLVADFRALLSLSEAEIAAESLAALIDGLYVRHALRQSGPNTVEAIMLCLRLVDDRLGRNGGMK